MPPVIVTDLTFQKEVIESPLPVLVDFWAPWCAPCKVIAPFLEELAKEYGGRLKIAKLNTDENQATAM
ncbi:thiol reductase thioredoxin, partial [candidate division KSB1 bacterium]